MVKFILLLMSDSDIDELKALLLERDSLRNERDKLTVSLQESDDWIGGLVICLVVCGIYALIVTCGANNLSSDLTLYRSPIDDRMTKAIENCVLQRKDGLVLTRSVVACYQELMKNETEPDYLLPDGTVHFQYMHVLDYYKTEPSQPPRTGWSDIVKGVAKEAPVRYPYHDKKPK